MRSRPICVGIVPVQRGIRFSGMIASYALWRVLSHSFEVRQSTVPLLLPLIDLKLLLARSYSTNPFYPLGIGGRLWVLSPEI